jgi:hypothetical protein
VCVHEWCESGCVCGCCVHLCVCAWVWCGCVCGCGLQMGKVGTSAQSLAGTINPAHSGPCPIMPCGVGVGVGVEVGGWLWVCEYGVGVWGVLGALRGVGGGGSERIWWKLS